MTAYIIRRLLLIVPTLFAIMLINFVIIQTAPGGPVEQVIAQLTGEGAAITERVTQSGTGRNTGHGRRPEKAPRRQVPRRAGIGPGVYRAAGETVRLRQAAA